ncbi:hypothetical protein HMPREF9069_01548 [Atopobium sp. oral taxon 810 str. F0209]|nr:hypothetical protein HMPREF9069_01548 [Atopobium sp. oral taxon 810 str. F0209]
MLCLPNATDCFNQGAALRVKSHTFFQSAWSCLPEATHHFKQSGSACQTPRSVSEKMSKDTLYFKGSDVSAGRFFRREEMGVKRCVAFG